MNEVIDVSAECRRADALGISMGALHAREKRATGKRVLSAVERALERAEQLKREAHQAEQEKMEALAGEERFESLTQDRATRLKLYNDIESWAVETLTNFDEKLENITREFVRLSVIENGMEFKQRDAFFNLHGAGAFARVITKVLPPMREEFLAGVDAQLAMLTEEFGAPVPDETKADGEPEGNPANEVPLERGTIRRYSNEQNVDESQAA